MESWHLPGSCSPGGSVDISNAGIIWSDWSRALYFQSGTNSSSINGHEFFFQFLLASRQEAQNQYFRTPHSQPRYLSIRYWSYFPVGLRRDKGAQTYRRDRFPARINLSPDFRGQCFVGAITKCWTRGNSRLRHSPDKIIFSSIGQIRACDRILVSTEDFQKMLHLQVCYAWNLRWMYLFYYTSTIESAFL